MSKQLYEEALADVKKLKEVAEDNAKRALLEAVTPRIRDLIENQLLGESEEDDDKLLMDELPQLGAEELAPPVDVSASVGDADSAAAAMSMPDEEGKVTLDLDALKTASGEYELSREAAEKLGMLMSSKANANLQFEAKLQKIAAQTKLFAAASRIIKESAGYSEQISIIISQVRDMYQHLQENMQHAPKKVVYEKLLKNCYSTLKQLTEQKMKKTRNTLSEAEITLKLTGVPDDLADKLDDLGVDLITGGGEEGEEEEEGGDDDLDLGDEEEGGEEEGGDDLDLGDEESDDESDEESEEKMESRRLSDNTIVEIDEGMLRREISRMKALREADETKPASWGNGPGDVSDDFEDDDLGDPFVDIDLTTEGDDQKDEAEEKDEADMDELDELDQAMQDEAEEKDEADMDELDQAMKQIQDEAEEKDEADMDELDQAEDTEEYGGARDEAQTQKQSRQAGATVESLKRRLAAELKLQTEAKKKAQSAKKQQKEAQQKAKKKQQEAQQKVKQKKQQEAQKAKQEAQKQAKQAKKMQEAYVFFATKFNESVARTNKIKSVLVEAARKGSVLNGGSARSAAETDNLRAKLAETNLFNAKLLFTNKLLQNESLTKRQKAEVIERLDEARSEREVKLVYESLTKALQGTTSRQLSESTDRGVLGSSSRPARPASTNLNEGFEADRWARLAGIVK